MAVRKNIRSRAKPHLIDDVRRELQDMQRRLEAIHSCMVTVIAALKAQAADEDTVFAACLLGGVVNPLTAEAQRLATLVSN